MKKILSIALVIALAAAIFTGCGNNSESAGGTVSTDGSTSMEKVIGALGESFMEANDGVTFTYNPTGSGSIRHHSSFRGTLRHRTFKQEPYR